MARAEAPYDALVIGAGPAGLAVAACLLRHGSRAAVLEQTEDVGASWRGHYERLHLHTLKQYSALPYKGFPAWVEPYPSRLQMVDYLESYAQEMGVRPHFNHRVDRLRRKDGAWEASTEHGKFRAPMVVLATGYCGVPHRPTWEGMASYEGEIFHSSEYVNGSPFREKRVLVVGMGNSGAEIALDLWEHGAAVSLSVRSPVHIVPRDVFGIPSQMSSLLMNRLPVPVADRLAGAMVRLAVGDLKRYGLHRPKIGPIAQVQERGRIPVVDVGTLGLIKQGQIRVVGGLERFTKTGVMLSSGGELPADAVLLATGFRPAIHGFLDGAGGYLNEKGYPKEHGVDAKGDGIFFIGFRNPIIGQLNDIAQEAKRIAATIANGRGAY